MTDTQLCFQAKQGILIDLPHAFHCALSDGTLLVQLWYDFSPKPLVLTANAQSGDAVRLVLRTYRIELYVNDALCDEEWPCGERILQTQMLPDSMKVLPVPTETLSQPDVLRTFTQAEGWKPEVNVFAGDCMPYVSGGRYHVLYLKDRHHHTSKWGLGAHQWAHISTSDFITWQEHPLAVEIDDPTEGSICTGSHIEQDGTHFLYYTVRTCDGSPAPICRSVSHDGVHFEKDRGFSFTLSARYTAHSARDPKVVQDANGLFHMIITTSLAAEQRGCLAHLTSSDLRIWHEEAQPLYIAPADGGEPECPDYAVLDGHNYLIFSLHSVGQYLLSEQPFANFRAPSDPVIPCSSVPKCAPWQDKLVFAGFKGDGRYAGTLTFRTAGANTDGEMVFE